MVTRKCSLTVLIICIVTAIFITIMNVFMYQSLFVQGVNWIYSYQQAQSSKFVIVVYNLFSICTGPLGVGVIIGIYLIAVKRKLKLFVHICIFMYCTHLMAVIKQATQSARPFWYDQRIQMWDWLCTSDSGNPSGHATAVLLLYEPIFSDSIGYLKYHLAVIPLCVFGSLVMISRLYLGVHSSDQILYGVTLGLIFLVAFKFVFQQALYHLFWGFLTGKASYKKIKYFFVIFLNLVTIAYPILFFQVYTQNNPIPQRYFIQINQICDVQLTNTQIQTSMMKSSAIGCTSFGFLFAISFLPNKTYYKKYFLGLWKYKSKAKFILKVFIYGICAGFSYIFAALGEFVAKASLLQYFLQLFAIELAGFLVVFLAPILTQKFKIVDFLPLEEQQRSPSPQNTQKAIRDMKQPEK